MTAHAIQGAQEICLSHGMDGYMSKPIDVEVLAAAQLERPASGEQLGMALSELDEALVELTAALHAYQREAQSDSAPTGQRP